MSQNEDKTLVLYYVAIESYEEVEALFHQKHVDIFRIRTGMRNCYHTIENIIIADANEPFLVHLFQLKNHMLELIKILETRTSSPSKALTVKPASKDSPRRDKQDLRSMVESTMETPRVKGFKEVAGMWEIKKMMQSLVILPKTQPQLFNNRKVFNSILLFGPPGTGKTRLVHALAHEAEANLFCVTAGNLLSPLVGQTEKNIKFLFDYIKSKETFSLLFIDEVDSFCRKRSSSEQDHNRRVKTELLCQINQMETYNNCFLICATNCPWDIDTAFLRRFQKRVYIPLPSYAERRDLFKNLTKNTPLEENFDGWEYIIGKTEGWSGSDISDLVQQAMNIPIFELQDTKIWKNCSDGFYEPVTEAEDFNLEEIHCSELKLLPVCSVRARNVQPIDLTSAFDNVSMTVTKSEIQKYEDFCKQ